MIKISLQLLLEACDIITAQKLNRPMYVDLIDQIQCIGIWIILGSIKTINLVIVLSDKMSKLSSNIFFTLFVHCIMYVTI